MVVMKGGTSGNREDAIVPMPGFDPQIPQNTANSSGGITPMLQMSGGTTGNSVSYPLPQVPGGGTPDDSAT